MFCTTRPTWWTRILFIKSSNNIASEWKEQIVTNDTCMWHRWIFPTVELESSVQIAVRWIWERGHIHDSKEGQGRNRGSR